MRLNIIITTSALIAGGLITASCSLKNQIDYFDSSAAERTEAAISAVAALLDKPEYGWKMEYFVGNSEQDRGGFYLTLKFDSTEGSVDVRSQEYKDSVCSSYYRFSNDDGPVLSFDTYNDLLHKYAVASSSHYEGQGGDFEFLINSYSENEIILKGKRSEKFCRMTPLDMPAKDFSDGMYDLSRSFVVSAFDGTLNGKLVKGEIDVIYHQFTFQEVAVDENGEIILDADGKPDINSSETYPYILTRNNGQPHIKFYKPAEFMGAVFDGIDISMDDNSLSAPGFEAKGFIPEDWLPYDFYIGNFELNYSRGAIAIELVPWVDGESFRVKGISSQFDLQMSYDIKTGRVSLSYQVVAKPDSDEAIVNDNDMIVVLCPWSVADGGSLWFNSSLGMEAVWNRDEDLPVFTWKDWGLVRSFHTDSFILYYYDPNGEESSYGGAAEGYSFTGGTHQLSNLTTLIKKK